MTAGARKSRGQLAPLMVIRSWKESFQDLRNGPGGLVRALQVWIYPTLRRVPGVARLQRYVYIRDLQGLHDTLERTPLRGHYWIWGGLLIGWAREGAVLSFDTEDADFCVRAEDRPLFDAAVPALMRAGFRRHGRFVNNDGEVVMLSLRRHGARFEFYMMESHEGMLRYFVYGDTSSGEIEVECQIPDQDLTSFDFLGRTWLKHVDHDAELTAIYGDWRTPKADWSYLAEDQAALANRPRRQKGYRWE